MIAGARRLAARLTAAAARLLPPPTDDWARAMAREIDEIEGDAEALRFAIGCLGAIVRQAVAARLGDRSDAPSRRSLPSDPELTMSFSLAARPRLFGLACAAAAAGVGLAFMAAAGAPPRYLATNLAAFAIGLCAWFAFGPAARLAGRTAGAAVLALGAGILATALFGIEVEGASRWIALGPVVVQTSLVLLPAAVVIFASRPDGLGAAGVAVAALAIALQPDRGMASALAFGLAALALARPSLATLAAFAAGSAAFAWTMAQADGLPAMPFVDGVLFGAFDVHPLAGLVVVAGAGALALPVLSGDAASRPILLAFGAFWTGVVAAAALGNYPTPLVGYGGGAVLGYLAAVALLPDPSARAASAQASDTTAQTSDGGRLERSALATGA